MNLDEKFEQFMIYYKEKMKVVDNVIICSAKNSKDQKIKMNKAWLYITSLSLNLVAVKSTNNSFIIKSII